MTSLSAGVAESAAGPSHRTSRMMEDSTPSLRWPPLATAASLACAAYGSRKGPVPRMWLVLHFYELSGPIERQSGAIELP